MTRTDRTALLCLLLAMFVAPALIGALQQGEQRQEQPIRIVVERWQSPTPRPTRNRPTMTMQPRTPAPVFFIELPTPNPWLRQPSAELVQEQIARGMRHGYGQVGQQLGQ